MKHQKNLRQSAKQNYALLTLLVLALSNHNLVFAAPLNVEHNVTNSNSQNIQIEDVVMANGDGGELKTVKRP